MAKPTKKPTPQELTRPIRTTLGNFARACAQVAGEKGFALPVGITVTKANGRARHYVIAGFHGRAVALPTKTAAAADALVALLRAEAKGDKTNG